MNTIIKEYQETIYPQLQETFKIENPMQVPALKKININTGFSEANDNIIKEVTSNLAAITGQKPALTRAKKAVSNFKIRKGDIVGCQVTLRKGRMYDFLQRLVHIVIPSIRDFQGIPRNSFDGNGNYNMGLHEIIIFPEINPDNVEYNHGLDISIVTTTNDDKQAFKLLQLFGMPFEHGE